MEVRGFSMDEPHREPQAEQLVETLDHCGAPRAGGGLDKRRERVLARVLAEVAR